MVDAALVETCDDAADAGFLRDHIKVKVSVGRDGLTAART